MRAIVDKATEIIGPISFMTGQFDFAALYASGG
jgi:hypothetical protein